MSSFSSRVAQGHFSLFRHDKVDDFFFCCWFIRELLFLEYLTVELLEILYCHRMKVFVLPHLVVLWSWLGVRLLLFRDMHWHIGPLWAHWFFTLFVGLLIIRAVHCHIGSIWIGWLFILVL